MPHSTFNTHEWHERKLNSQRRWSASRGLLPQIAAGQLAGALAPTPITLWAEVKVRLRTWREPEELEDLDDLEDLEELEGDGGDGELEDLEELEELEGDGRAGEAEGHGGARRAEVSWRSWKN